MRAGRRASRTRTSGTTRATPRSWSATSSAAFAAADAAHAGLYQQQPRRVHGRSSTSSTRTSPRRSPRLPVAQRKLVTNHDAFGYYVDRYQLEFVGSIIPSFDTSAELSGQAASTDLVAKIKATGVKAIFSESSLPPKTAEAIAAAGRGQGRAGEDSLYGDTLGPAGSAGDTYLKMEQHNTDVIVRASEMPDAATAQFDDGVTVAYAARPGPARASTAGSARASRSR